MTQIDLQQAVPCFPALVELAASGEEVIVAKENRPFIKLISAKGLIKMADDFNAPLEGFKEYMECAF